MTTTTQHTCGGPVFGRKTPGCPRCDELLAGAAPVRWAWAERKRAQEKRAARYPQPKHDCKKSNCAPICTFGDW